MRRCYVVGLAVDGWVIEQLTPFFKSGIKTDELIFEKQSRYQLIQIYSSEAFGKVLVLDGAVQTTEKDEYCYHEMLVSLPFLLHGGVKRSLIIGGGDGGALRTMLEMGTSEAWICELDVEVIEACQTHMPEISAGAFNDPRAKLVIKDGFEFMAEKEGYFDLICVDSPDPVGEAEKLYSSEFYRRVKHALAPGGVVACQSGSPWLQPDLGRAVFAGLSENFRYVLPYYGLVPSYPGVVWLFTFASDTVDPLAANPPVPAGMKIIDENNLKSFFRVPGWIKQVVKSGEW